jgi:hypothetical protein
MEVCHFLSQSHFAMIITENITGSYYHRAKIQVMATMD